MGYLEQNRRKIERSLGSWPVRKDAVILQTLTDVMQMAINIAFDLHEMMGLHLHLEIGDDYGWMITKDGVPMKTEVHAAPENIGTARDKLMSLTWMASDTGWDAILMAGMKAAHYNEERERHILEGTASEVARNFLEVFEHNWQMIR